MKAVRLKRPNGTWSPPIYDEAPLRKSITLRLKPLDGPFQITEPGVGTGPKLITKTAIDRTTNRLLVENPGTHLLTRNAAGKGVHGRVVETQPEPANTQGSPGVDLVVGWLNAEFHGQWEAWGIYVYKHIAGSSSWSDHSYVNNPAHWCGRAIDVHPQTMAIGDLIKAKAMAEPAIANALRYLLWRVPDHYDHLHFSMDDPGSPGRCL